MKNLFNRHSTGEQRRLMYMVQSLAAAVMVCMTQVISAQVQTQARVLSEYSRLQLSVYNGNSIAGGTGEFIENTMRVSGKYGMNFFVNTQPKLQIYESRLESYVPLRIGLPGSTKFMQVGTSDAFSYIDVVGSSPLQFRNGSLVNLMTLTPEGRLGIGTSPAYSLDVKGSINSDEVLVGGTSLRDVVKSWIDSDFSDFDRSTRGTEYTKVDSRGPWQMLFFRSDVAKRTKNIGSYALQLEDFESKKDFLSTFSVHSSVDHGIRDLTYYFLAHDWSEGGTTALNLTNSTVATAEGYTIVANSSSLRIKLAAESGGGGLTLKPGASSAERLANVNNYLFGINNPAPTEALDVFGRVRITSSEAATTLVTNPTAAEGTNAIYLDGFHGRIGIGKSEPSESLDVIGNLELTSGNWNATGPTESADQTSNKDNVHLFLGDRGHRIVSSASAGMKFVTTSGDFVFLTRHDYASKNNVLNPKVDSYSLRINSDGKVAIGNDLEVKGKVLVNGIDISGGAGASTWAKDGSGNISFAKKVAIGKTAPKYYLDVNGSASFGSTEEGAIVMNPANGWDEDEQAPTLASITVGHPDFKIEASSHGKLEFSSLGEFSFRNSSSGAQTNLSVDGTISAKELIINGQAYSPGNGGADTGTSKWLSTNQNDIHFNGRVGIGGNPYNDYKLAVTSASENYGIAHIAGGVTLASWIGSGQAWLGTFTNHPLVFYTNNNKDPQMKLDPKGNVYIHGLKGASAKSIKQTVLDKYSLIVEEGVLSEDFAMAPVASWADFVFDNDYQLPSLTEVAAFVKEHKHLPNIPTQADIAANGYSMHEMNIKLLEKIEQLTLYAIEQQNKIDTLEQIIAKQKQAQGNTNDARFKALEEQIVALQRMLINKQ